MASSASDSIRAVTGHTRIFGILADPIYHVKTPEVMNALFKRHGVDGVLILFHVAPDGLAAMVDGLRTMQNFRGFIATVPHKPAMLTLCDEITPEAKQIGAVNCVRREADGRMVGTMLDGIGFVEALRATGVEPKGMRAYVAGSGRRSKRNRLCACCGGCQPPHHCQSYRGEGERVGWQVARRLSVRHGVNRCECG